MVVTGAGFDGFAEILMVAAGEGGGGGSENLMGILTFLFILVYWNYRRQKFSIWLNKWTCGMILLVKQRVKQEEWNRRFGLQIN